MDRKKTAITENDNNKKAYELFKEGDYSNALPIYEKLSESNPDNRDYLFYYAESLRLTGNAGKASGLYDKLIALDKNNLAAIEGKGLVHLQNGDLAGALEQFNTVIEKDVSRWRTINAIGVIYSISGKEEEAKQYYNMALELSKNNPSVNNNIALSEAFSGNPEKGISLLKKVIASTPDGDARKVKFMNNLALLYGISGKMDEADAILRKNKLSEPAIYNNLGYYAKLSSDKKLAWDYLSKAISSSPVYYEKAENNMKSLGIIEDSNTQKEVVTEDEQPVSSKIEPVKAKRGTHRLPLPSLKP